jgi:hypothetical protein
MLPYWDPEDGSLDLYYWYWATLAMQQLGGAHFEEVGGRRATGPAPAPAASRGPPAGSWEPLSVWGVVAGRVCDTAFATLCLLAPHAYGPGFWKPGTGILPPHDAAVAALRAACADKDAAVRAAAAHALARNGLE